MYNSPEHLPSPVDLSKLVLQRVWGPLFWLCKRHEIFMVCTRVVTCPTAAATALLWCLVSFRADPLCRPPFHLFGAIHQQNCRSNALLNRQDHLPLDSLPPRITFHHPFRPTYKRDRARITWRNPHIEYHVNHLHCSHRTCST